MEILRFDGQSGTSAQGKKSSKGMLAIGLVATLFGIGSAFASSTIEINGDAPIALGQGVTAVTACDTSISIVPETSMRVGDAGPKFYVDTITVSGVDESVTNSSGIGCRDKYFDLEIFKTSAGVVSAIPCSPILVSSEDLTCSSTKISFQIKASSTAYTVPFEGFESDFSYVTLVSRDPS